MVRSVYFCLNSLSGIEMKATGSCCDGIIAAHWKQTSVWVDFDSDIPLKYTWIIVIIMGVSAEFYGFCAVSTLTLIIKFCEKH